MIKTNLKLDSQEKRIEKALRKGDFVRAPNLDKTKRMFQEAARNYRKLTQTKRITIRVNNEDLIKIKARAKRNNVPYQTLLKALVRQFVEGRARVQL